MVRKIVSFFIVVFLLFSTPAFGKRILWQAEGYLLEAILQVEAMDVDGDGRDELIVLGRNYEAREVFIYTLTWSGSEWLVLWKSPNLYETASPVAIAVGNFRGQGVELVALTNTFYRLYQWSSQGFVEVWHGANPFPVRLAVGVSVSGPQDYLVRTKLARQTDWTVFDQLVLLVWQEGKGFVQVASSAEIGHVRGITAVDLEPDGAMEVVVEKGDVMASGEVQVWQIRDNARFQRTYATTLSSSPIFALGGGEFLGRPVLVVGDNTGRVNTYGFTGGQLSVTGDQLRVGYGLVWAAVGRFTGNPNNEIALVRYPAELMLITD